MNTLIQRILPAVYFCSVRYLRPFASRAHAEKVQARLLKKHVTWIVEHSKFYASRDRGAHLPHSERFEIIDKAAMMANFNDLNTAGIDAEEALDIALAAERTRNFDDDLDGYSVGLSSGTSGHRGLFVVSAKERAQWAGTVLAKALPRRKILGHRIALFLRADNQLYESVNSHVVSFRFFDIYGDEARNVAELNDYQPTILVAPPSVLIELVKHDVVRSMRPAKIFSVAEVLDQLDETKIKEAFGINTVHQIYQCTEGLLAMTCERGVLHLNEDIVYVEKQYVAEHRFVPIITDLQRTTQPLVRYRLNDVLIERGTPCECGSAFTALERIEGREDDTFRCVDSTGVMRPIYADMISRALIHAEGVEEYRVVQHGLRDMIVYLAPNQVHVQQSVRESLNHLFTQQLGDEATQLIRIDFAPYARDSSKKLRRIESQLKELEHDHDN